MKIKTTLASLIGAMVIGTTGYSGYQTYEKNKTTTESDLFLENIEVLASDYEDDDKGEKKEYECYKVLRDRGEGSLNTMYCATCMTEDCSDYTESSKCTK